MTDPRNEWLAWRRTGIGGSDVAAVARIPGAFGSRYGVWLSKVSEWDDGETESMLWGTLLEKVVIDEVERRTGLFVGARQYRATHPDNRHHIATLDGALYESATRRDGGPRRINAPLSDAALAGLEVKVTWETSYPGGDPPDRYYAQAQWQMHTTGLQHVTLAVLHAGTKLETYDIPRDDADIAWLVDHVDAFWRDHVLANVEPPYEADDLPLVRKVVGATDGSVVTADPAVESLVAQVLAAQENAKQAVDYVDVLKAQLIAKVGKAAVVVDRFGEKLCSFKATREFDLDAAAAAHPDKYEAAVGVDVARFKKSLGRRADDYMVETDDRRLAFPRRKEPK